jgi:hypothetical protein
MYVVNRDQLPTANEFEGQVNIHVSPRFATEWLETRVETE